MSIDGEVPPLEILLTIDNKQALAKQAELGQSFGKVVGSADSAAKKIADGQFRAFDLMAKAAKRASVAQADAARRAAEAQMKAMASVSAKAVLTEAAVRAVGGAFSSMAGLATDAGGAIVKAMADAQKKTHEYAIDLLKVKDDLREVATLRGLSSASDEFVKSIAGFGRKTGLSVAQTDEYQRQLYGSAQAGLDKGNIDPGTLELLSVEAAKVASRQTKDVGTRGELIGILSQFKKYGGGRPGVEEALADAERVRLGLTEGRGDDAPLTKSLLHVAGQFTGKDKQVATLPELAALLGVTSLSAGPGQADSRVEQLVRGVSGGTADQAAFLKGFAGINEGESLEARLDKLVPALRAKKAEGRDISAFLIENKVPEEQVRALAETEPLYEVLKARLGRARSGTSGADIIAESERQARLDPLQRQKLAEADLAAAKLARGEEKQDIVANLRSAEARLVRSGRDTSVLEGAGDFLRYVGSGFTKEGFQVRTESEALAAFRPRDGVERGFADLAGSSNPLLQGLASLLGKTNDELVALQKRQLDVLEKQTRLMEKDRADPLGPARPRAPVGP